MVEMMRFAEFVCINPRVNLEKGKNYPFIEMEAVSPGRRYVTSRKTRPFKGGGSKFRSGDTLFARITPCLENGKIAQFAGLGSQECFGSTEFFVFRANPGISEPAYVYYLASTDLIRGPAEKSMSGASGRQRADIQSIADLQVPAPTHPIQRKIATILSAYDDLIENNLQRIKILEDMAQSLYQEWFVKFRFPGHERVRMVDSPLGKIPERWELIKIGGLLEKVKRKKKLKKQSYVTDGPIPVVDQGRDFIGGYTTDQETLFDSPLPIIVFGDHTRILKYVDFPFACGADGTQLLRPNTERMPISLFYYVLKSIDLSDFAYARHFKFLKEQGVLIPNEQIARLFAQVADPMRDLIRCLLSRNTNLRRTRDLLLPKLISGELDVSDLDIKTGGHIQ